MLLIHFFFSKSDLMEKSCMDQGQAQEFMQCYLGQIQSTLTALRSDHNVETAVCRFESLCSYHISYPQVRVGKQRIYGNCVNNFWDMQMAVLIAVQKYSVNRTRRWREQEVIVMYWRNWVHGDLQESTVPICSVHSNNYWCYLIPMKGVTGRLLLMNKDFLP